MYIYAINDVSIFALTNQNFKMIEFSSLYDICNQQLSLYQQQITPKKILIFSECMSENNDVYPFRNPQMRIRLVEIRFWFDFLTDGSGFILMFETYFQTLILNFIPKKKNRTGGLKFSTAGFSFENF